jgi:Xaa-Pro aminopeptidase
MALTVEPGIYIPDHAEGVDPKWWNIGVRIEDDVLVTASGMDCLSCGAPREAAEVEKAIRGR